jgi:hypothetical protein
LNAARRNVEEALRIIDDATVSIWHRLRATGCLVDKRDTRQQLARGRDRANKNRPRVPVHKR